MFFYKTIFVSVCFSLLIFSKGDQMCENSNVSESCLICPFSSEDTPENIELSKVVCDHAKLKNIPDQFNVYEAVTIQNDDFIILPSLSKYNKLINLYLNYNRIRLISDGALANLSSLSHVSLSHNYIEALYDNTFEGLKNLRHLSLTSNKICLIYFQVFTDMNIPQLAYLYLNQNNIVKVERESFHGLSHLVHLDLSMNRIEILERFANQNGMLTSLKILNIGYNKISQIPDNFFEFMPVLEELRLEHNFLTSVTQTDFKLLANNLVILDLQGNLISEVGSKCFQNLQKLEKIDLSHNLLHELKVKALPKMSENSGNNASIMLLIYGNPIDCTNCDNSWLVENPMLKLVNWLNETLCETPSNLTFGQATDSLFGHCRHDSESSMKTVSLFVFLFVCFSLLILATLYLMYRLRKKRRSNTTLDLGERGSSTSPSKGAFSYRGLQEQFPFSIDEADENRI